VARVLLLLPTATYRAPDFLAAARRLGVEVVVGSEQAQTMAGTMGDRALVLDLADPPAALGAIVALHGRSPVDGVVAVDDQGVVVAALAGEKLGLPHNPVDAVRATRDKAMMRSLLAGAGVPQPRFAVAVPGDDVAASASGIGLPCVVKPLSLSASRGVIRADTPAEASAAAERVRAILACAGAGEGTDDRLLVESFVPGAEVAVEGILRGGVLDVLAVFDKPDPLDGPYFEETIYVTPSRHGADLVARIEAATARATAAIGLREGPVHAELRLPPDGSVAVLEVAARSIGGLCARTLRFGTGTSLEELILLHALGRPAGDAGRERAAAGVMMLPIPRAGVLERVDGRDEARAVPGIVELDVSIPLGRPVEPLPEGDRYIGFLFARADTPDAVEAALRAAHARLDIVIAPVR
jgi:biotin carboxylase